MASFDSSAFDVGSFDSGSFDITVVPTGSGAATAQSVVTAGVAKRSLSGTGTAVALSSVTAGVATNLTTGLGAAIATDSVTSGVVNRTVKSISASAIAQNAVTSGYDILPVTSGRTTLRDQIINQILDLIRDQVR